MGDGDKLLIEIKSRMNDKDNPLDTDTAVQFLLSLQIEHIEKDKVKAKTQDTSNERVKILWRERKVIFGFYAAVLLGILGVIFDAINISIDFG